MQRVVFDHHQLESENIWTFYLKPDRPLDYTAGQFIELTLKHHSPDSRGEKRWFTLSSAPSDEFLTITTRINQVKSSSFKKALTRLVPGQELTMSEPMGDFVLPKLIQTPLVFVAGGIGITPYHSILNWLIGTHAKRPIQLIYGVRNEDDIIFQDTFREAGQHVSVVVESPSSAWGGERGSLSAELILGLTKPTADSLIYVAGPEPMTEALEKALLKRGVSKHQLVLDFFPNYPTI
jgi:ferredoxin-NADP reductase